MKLNTSALIGSALDWAVAKCRGIEPLIRPYAFKQGAALYSHGGATIPLEYSTNWSQGGPIIEHIKGFLFKHWLEANREGQCQAEIHNYDGDWIAFGPTPLIAAMRCYVASRLGDTVDVPEELLP